MICFMCRFTRVVQAGLLWWVNSNNAATHLSCLFFQINYFCARTYMIFVCVCSMWMTTWQSCLLVSCLAAQMMLWSGEDPRRMVSVWVCVCVCEGTQRMSVLLPLALLTVNCLSPIRDDQAIFEGRGLGGPGLPHCGHAPWHIWWASVDCPVPKLHPRWWSCHHHHTTGTCIRPITVTTPTLIALVVTVKGNPIGCLLSLLLDLQLIFHRMNLTQVVVLVWLLMFT